MIFGVEILTQLELGTFPMNVAPAPHVGHTGMAKSYLMLHEGTHTDTTTL